VPRAFVRSPHVGAHRKPCAAGGARESDIAWPALAVSGLRESPATFARIVSSPFASRDDPEISARRRRPGSWNTSRNGWPRCADKPCRLRRRTLKPPGPHAQELRRRPRPCASKGRLMPQRATRNCWRLGDLDAARLSPGRPVAEMSRLLPARPSDLRTDAVSNITRARRATVSTCHSMVLARDRMKNDDTFGETTAPPEIKPVLSCVFGLPYSNRSAVLPGAP